MPIARLENLRVPRDKGPVKFAQQELTWRNLELPSAHLAMQGHTSRKMGRSIVWIAHQGDISLLLLKPRA